MKTPLSNTLNLSDLKETGASGPVSIQICPDKAQFNLRIAASEIKAASDAFGLEIPIKIHQQSITGQRSALCLGPDEWRLEAAEEETDQIKGAFTELYPAAPHSLTNISDRQVTIEIKGAQAADLLSIACPRDLSAIKAGEGVRTLFDTVEIVLIRKSDDVFCIDVWRSFYPHVWGLLKRGNAEFSTGL